MAVLCVYVSHLLSAAGWAHFGSLGRFGVILFFVHTSFVLVASLDRMAQTHDNRHLLFAFAARRFFRIYPLSIVMVLGVTLLMIPGMPSSHYYWIGWRDFVSNLAITQTLTYSNLSLEVLWSLPLEVQMYCLLPFMYLGIKSRQFASFFFLCISVIAALTVPTITGRLVVFSYAPCFSAGVCGFDLARTLKPRFPAWIWPFVLLAALAAFRPLDNISLPEKLPRAWLISLAVGIAVPCFYEITFKPLSTLAHLVAKYSYGIYLIHTVVFWLAFKQMASFPTGVRIVALVLGSVAGPVAMYHLIEKPAISFGKKLVANVFSSIDSSARKPC